MAKGPWGVIVLTAPRDDFAALCRASRRLQPGAKLVALCPVAQEPAARSLVGDTQNDYLIDPPTRRDIASLHRWATGSPDASPASFVVQAQPDPMFTRIPRTCSNCSN